MNITKILLTLDKTLYKTLNWAESSKLCLKSFHLTLLVRY